MAENELKENVKLKYDMFHNPETSLPSLSDNQLNVLMYLLAMLKDKENSTVEISIDEFLQVLRIGSKKRLSRAETNQLVTKTINTFMKQLLTQIVDTDELYEIKSIRLFETASWNKTNDILTMVAAQEFIPMLNQLTSYFVEFPLIEYVKLRGKYVKRLYFELTKYKGLNIGKADFEYSLLLKLLKVPDTIIKANHVFTSVLNDKNIEKLKIYFPELEMSVKKVNRKPSVVKFTWNARKTKVRFNNAIKANKSYARELNENSLIKTGGALGKVLTMLEEDGTVDALNNELFLDHEFRNEVYEYALEYYIPNNLRMSELIERILVDFEETSFYSKNTKQLLIDNAYTVPERFSEIVKDAKKYKPTVYLKILKGEDGLITTAERFFVDHMMKDIDNMYDEITNMVMWYELVERQQPEMNINTVETIANRWLHAGVQTAEQAVEQIIEYQSKRIDTLNHQKKNHRTRIIEPSISVDTNNSEPTELSTQGQRDMAQLNERLKKIRTKR